MNDFVERQRIHQETVGVKIENWKHEIHELVLKTTHHHMGVFFQAQGVEHYGHTGVTLTDRGLAPAHFDDAAVHEQANGHTHGHGNGNGGVFSGGESSVGRAAAGGEGGAGAGEGEREGSGEGEGAEKGGAEGGGGSEEDGGTREMSYTERAAVHTECRSLVKFIRLVELMVAEALIATATTSAMTLLARMRLSTRYG